jgi:hypothetical protein
MKIHIAKFIDLSAKRGGWPSHSSLVGLCGRTRPSETTNRRGRATCKACLKAQKKIDKFHGDFA